MIEYGVDKVERQPLVQDPTFIDPATDDSAGPLATGFAMTVFCDAPPNDGDVAVYVAANTRFELRAGASAIGLQPVIEDDGSGNYVFVTEDGSLVYETP